MTRVARPARPQGRVHSLRHCSSATRAARRSWFRRLILDARYEKVREDGVVQSQAILVAIGINSDGKRHVWYRMIGCCLIDAAC